ncbi:hypothetical protein [Pseudoxanthomonas taiwanensis]|uniref:Uncharacterized protein n=1 Tax=Pseudoxanthomonas taiwanensis TaxID=176598 RepID=A0A921NY33_9GAMM|nr:hypothetical protein [Pseudoxanthomonas taiwanensis]KAF1685009.1 hypothetical protein CR938_13255 [Pseudoxanthomonas taiwanensis]
MDADRPGLDQLRRSTPWLAALLVLLAAWFAWSGVQQWRGQVREDRLAQARDQAVATASAAANAQAARLGERLQDETVRAALALGEAGVAASAITAGWPRAEQAVVLGADLAGAYGQAAEFGYSRLALLEDALSNRLPSQAP